MRLIGFLATWLLRPIGFLLMATGLIAGGAFQLFLLSSSPAAWVSYTVGGMWVYGPPDYVLVFLVNLGYYLWRRKI